jgi:hypothetical protein
MGAGHDAALIIVDGGLASLLACFIEGVCRPAARITAGPDEPATGPIGGSAWFALRPSLVHEYDRRLMAAKRSAEVSHLAEVLEAGNGPWPVAGPELERGLGTSSLLMAAGIEALRRGYQRVVWPVQLGGPGGEGLGDSGMSPGMLDAVAEACDRAMVASRLLTLDAGAEGLAIQTPFVDFSDVQLADLAADVDLPVHVAFMGEKDGAERARWERAFGAVGVAIDDLSAGTLPIVRPRLTEPVRAV